MHHNHNNQCRDCHAPNAADNFQCPANNAAHVQCSFCFNLMPNRNLPKTICTGCSRVGCSQYWPNSACASFMKPLSQFNMVYHATLVHGIAHEVKFFHFFSGFFF
jgi:hypothetical protein